MPTTITQFTNIPSRGQAPGVFGPLADDFLGNQLPRFVTEANTMAGELNETVAGVDDTVEALQTTAQAMNNFLGRWSDLTGPVSTPTSVQHDNTMWLLMQGMGEVSDVEPGTNPAFWMSIMDAMGYVLLAANGDLLLGSDIATDAQYRSNTAKKVLTTDATWGAAVPVALTPAASVVVNMRQGINFRLTTAQNCTLANPTNAKPGQSGTIDIVNGGGHIISFGSAYAFASGVEPEMGVNGARYVLSYGVLHDGRVLISAHTAVA